MDDNFAVISREHEAQDPFDERDSIESTSDELDDLIHQLNMPAETRCSVHEYINGDDGLPTYSVLDDET